MIIVGNKCDQGHEGINTYEISKQELIDVALKYDVKITVNKVLIAN